MSNEIRTALENLLDAMDQMGSCQYETLRSDARAALNRDQGGQGAEPFAYYRRGRGHEMLFASDLDTGFVPGDDWTPLYTQPQPAVPEADELRSALSDVVSVAITMLYDSHKPDVVEEFTIDELKDVVERTKHLQDARVEDVYRAGYRLLTTPTPTTTPQADGWVGMADGQSCEQNLDSLLLRKQAEALEAMAEKIRNDTRGTNTLWKMLTAIDVEAQELRRQAEAAERPGGEK